MSKGVSLSVAAASVAVAVGVGTFVMGAPSPTVPLTAEADRVGPDDRATGSDVGTRRPAPGAASGLDTDREMTWTPGPGPGRAVWITDADAASAPPPKTPFHGRYWNDAIGVGGMSVDGYRAIGELLRDASRARQRVQRLRAFRDATRVCRVWWSRDGGTGTAASILQSLLDVHAGEPRPEVRARELHELVWAAPPRRAASILTRLGDRARLGETESERATAVYHLGRFASRDIETRMLARAGADAEHTELRGEARRVRARALKLLQGLPLDGRSDSEQAGITEAKENGDDLRGRASR